MMQYSEICMYYLRGACRFGSRCWNSHDLNHRSPKTQALATATSKYIVLLINLKLQKSHVKKKLRVNQVTIVCVFAGHH